MKKILIVGTVSNVEDKLLSNFRKLNTYFSKYGLTDFHLVESNSRDSTVEVLSSIAQRNSNFSFVSLPNDPPELGRVARIRNARNSYVEFIRGLPKSELDYVVVVDFDMKFKDLDEVDFLDIVKGLVNYDGIFPSFKYGYYDLYALRHKYWMPYDIFQSLEWLNENARKSRYFGILTKSNLKDKLLYGLMLSLKRNQIVQVDSAFGGIGIYNPKIFFKVNYESRNLEESSTCEHIALHYAARDECGSRFAIDTNFELADVNMHNLNKIFLYRVLRRSYTKLRNTISEIMKVAK